MIRSRIRRARAMFRAIPLCGALMSLPFVAACDGGKPPEPAATAPVVAAPKPVVTPPAAPAATPAAVPAPPSAKQQADSDLARRVKAALEAEPRIRGFAIDVTAKDGAVALFGTALTKERRDVAGQVAKRVSGVKSVDNNLAIVAGS